MDNTEKLLPLYEKVRQGIVADIESGRFPQGSFLPNETELMDSFNVSRVTLRRAISELCSEGRLQRQQGRGTIVLQPKKMQQMLVSLSGFSETMDAMGKQAGHRILSREDQPDRPDIGSLLNATKLVCFKRLLENDGQPMMLETLWFDSVRFAAIVEPVANGDSFFSSLREKEHTLPAHVERKIDVDFCTSNERSLLDIPASQPVFRVEKMVTDANDQPLSLSHLVTPTNRVTYTLKT